MLCLDSVKKLGFVNEIRVKPYLKKHENFVTTTQKVMCKDEKKNMTRNE
jgi:hypothetical protein